VTVVSIGGTNGLLSQVKVRTILALVLYRMRRSVREDYGQELQRRVRLEGFFL
jgi:hypothetical protein